MKRTGRFCCLALLLWPAAFWAQVAPGKSNDLPQRGMIGLAAAAADTAKPKDPQTNPPSDSLLMETNRNGDRNDSK